MKTRKLFSLMIVLLIANLVSTPAWAVGCSATFWEMYNADGCGDGGCACWNTGSEVGCYTGDEVYIIDCSAGTSCDCYVAYVT